MARVLVVFDDLLLGSNLLGMLRAAGHEAELRGGTDLHADGADVLVIDLAAPDFDGVALVEDLRARGELAKHTRVLGVHSHVDVESRKRAEAAGFHLVVPRSRMARDGPTVIALVLDADVPGA